MEVLVEGHRAVSARAGDFGLRIERQERRGGIRWMDDVAQLAADDRVVAIVAGDRVAEVATLLVASEVLTAEEPAAWPLVDVAAQRAEVADQRRSHAQRRLSQQRKRLLQIFVLDDLGERGGGADVRAVRAHRDPLEIRDGGEIDDLDRQGHALALYPVLHDAADLVAPTTDHFDGGTKLIQQTDSLLDCRRLVQLKTLHNESFPRPQALFRPASTFSRVIGISVIQTPTAL